MQLKSGPDQSHGSYSLWDSSDVSACYQIKYPLIAYNEHTLYVHVSF